MKTIIFKSFALLVAFLGLSFESSAQATISNPNITTPNQVRVSAAAQSQLQSKTNVIGNNGSDKNTAGQNNAVMARKKPRPFVKENGPSFVKCANPPCF